MHGTLNHEVARVRYADMLREAREHRLARDAEDAIDWAPRFGRVRAFVSGLLPTPVARGRIAGAAA